MSPWPLPYPPIHCKIYKVMREDVVGTRILLLKLKTAAYCVDEWSICVCSIEQRKGSKYRQISIAYILRWSPVFTLIGTSCSFTNFSPHLGTGHPHVTCMGARVFPTPSPTRASMNLTSFPVLLESRSAGFLLVVRCLLGGRPSLTSRIHPSLFPCQYRTHRSELGQDVGWILFPRDGIYDQLL